VLVGHAREADAEAIVALRDAAARWQQERGIQQWSPGEVSVQQVHEQIRDGQWHVVRAGQSQAVQAAVRVLQEDPEVWGDRAGAALFVHGLVVDRAASGQGIGVQLLRWVEERARRGGVRWVRLDCVASNGRLRDYYVQQGFDVVGDKSFTNGWSPVVLLEKALSPVRR